MSSSAMEGWSCTKQIDGCMLPREKKLYIRYDRLFDTPCQSPKEKLLCTIADVQEIQVFCRMSVVS